MNNKNILFVVGLHGDEQIGKDAIEGVFGVGQRKVPKGFGLAVGNPRAYEKRVRFIDEDLNRIFPGDPTAWSYEGRRAHELLQEASRYRFVIDIHGTTASSGIFTIVANPTKENMLLAAALPFENIVIWESEHPNDRGPLTKFVPCGVEIEAGPQDADKTFIQLRDCISSIVRDDLTISEDALARKKVFRVYGKIMKKDPMDALLPAIVNDFERIAVDGELFYPLLVGQYPDKFCYKMRRVRATSLYRNDIEIDSAISI